MGNNQSSTRGGRSASSPRMSRPMRQRRERTHSGGTAMEVDGDGDADSDSVPASSMKSGETSGMVSPSGHEAELEASSRTSPEPDPGMDLYASPSGAAVGPGTSRRRRYQESTSTVSTRSGSSSTADATQKHQITSAEPVDRPSFGRRISSAFGRRKTERSERKSNPLEGRGESSSNFENIESKGKGKERDTGTEGSSAAGGAIQEEVDQEIRRDRGSRGQGEMKRRRISGIFSATPSRTNSDTALAARTQTLSTDDQQNEKDFGSGVVVDQVMLPETSEMLPQSATLMEDNQLERPLMKPGSDDAPAAVESDPLSSVPSNLPGSPPVIPLTETDPLLDDRLRTLSTIWEVLGSDVARSLPAVATAEAVRRASVTGSIRSREAVVEGLATPVAEYEPVVPDMDLASLPALPPSTVSLLDDLEADARSRATIQFETGSPLEALLGGSTGQVPTLLDSELPAIVIPPTPDTRSEHFVPEPVQATSSDNLLRPPTIPLLTPRPSASSLLTTGTGTTDTSTTSSSQDRRRSRIGGLAERVGSWFGIGNGEGNAEAERSQAATQTATPLLPAASASSVDPQPTSTAPAPRPRLPQGAVMIVQGFVQTSIPASREGSNAGDSPARAESPLSTTVPPRSQGPIRAQSATDVNATAFAATATASAAASDEETAAESSSSRPIRPDTPRRVSEGDQPSTTTPREGRSGRFGRGGIWGRYRSSPDSEPPNFAEQARMLAGLLR